MEILTIIVVLACFMGLFYVIFKFRHVQAESGAPLDIDLGSSSADSGSTLDLDLNTDSVGDSGDYSGGGGDFSGGGSSDSWSND